MVALRSFVTKSARVSSVSNRWMDGMRERVSTKRVRARRCGQVKSGQLILHAHTGRRQATPSTDIPPVSQPSIHPSTRSTRTQRFFTKTKRQTVLDSRQAHGGDPCVVCGVCLGVGCPPHLSVTYDKPARSRAITVSVRQGAIDVSVQAVSPPPTHTVRSSWSSCW